MQDGVQTNSVSSANDRAVIYDGMSVQYALAPFGKRILAYCVDLAIVSGLMYGIAFVCILPIAGLGAGLNHLSKKGALAEWMTTWAGVGVIVLAFVLFLLVASIYHGYFVVYEKKKGATPGKRIFGLRVISLKGNRLTYGQCISRDMLRYVDCMMVFPGLISILATQKRQRLGDILASTLVVHSKTSEAQYDFLYLSQNDFNWLKESMAPSEVPKDVCERFLKFAYPEFILLRPGNSSETLHEWEKVARAYLPGVTRQDFKQREVLLFFAEWCSQRLNKGDKK